MDNTIYYVCRTARRIKERKDNADCHLDWRIVDNYWCPIEARRDADALAATHPDNAICVLSFCPSLGVRLVDGGVRAFSTKMRELPGCYEETSELMGRVACAALPFYSRVALCCVHIIGETRHV